MIAKLQRWVWLGSSVLAFIAGMINAVGFMGFQHQGVTHLTGSATLLGIAVATGNTIEGLHLLFVIASFFGGCVLGGAIVLDSTLRLGRRYGVALFLEALLLCAAAILLAKRNLIGDYLAGGACGLQNGIVSTYSGAVLRTTHISGMVTDLGICVGQALRGVGVDARRIKLCALLIVSFFLGGIAGALCFNALSYATLYIPAALTGTAGLAYGIYRHRKVGGVI